MQLFLLYSYKHVQFSHFFDLLFYLSFQSLANNFFLSPFRSPSLSPQLTLSFLSYILPTLPIFIPSFMEENFLIRMISLIKNSWISNFIQLMNLFSNPRSRTRVRPVGCPEGKIWRGTHSWSRPCICLDPENERPFKFCVLGALLAAVTLLTHDIYSSLVTSFMCH